MRMCYSVDMTNAVKYPLMCADIAWDAEIVAHNHPEVFALDGCTEGRIYFVDPAAVAKLRDPAIELDTDGEGLILRVFGVDAKVYRASAAA